MPELYFEQERELPPNQLLFRFYLCSTVGLWGLYGVDHARTESEQPRNTNPAPPFGDKPLTYPRTR